MAKNIFVRAFFSYKTLIMLQLSLCCLIKPVQAKTFTSSFGSAATSGWFLVPGAMALAIGLTSLDKDITSFAARERPIFGSTGGARDKSDLLAFRVLPALTLTTSIYYGTSDTASAWSLLSFLPPVLLSQGISSLVKGQTKRLRPDGSNDRSFPSGHTALAAAFGHEARSNLSPHLSSGGNLAFTLLQETLVMSVAWARMEGNKHHLSDVLAGYALGKFFAILTREWLFDEQQEAVVWGNSNLNDDFQVGLRWSF